jgi:RimJ/RimL family protein N-acetyltransferase
MSVPVLETPRLILRGHRPDDFAAALSLWGDAQVTRFIGGHPLKPEDVWARLLRYAGLWAMLGYGFWLVEERGTGTFVGEVGLHDLQRDTSPSFAGTPEAGWALMPTAHGKGYAGEAVAAMLGWADARGMDRTVCIIAPENAASVRVAEKQGYRVLADGTYKGNPTRIFERIRPA